MGGSHEPGGGGSDLGLLTGSELGTLPDARRGDGGAERDQNRKIKIKIKINSTGITRANG
jgi:hypothetical protein